MTEPQDHVSTKPDGALSQPELKPPEAAQPGSLRLDGGGKKGRAGTSSAGAAHSANDVVSRSVVIESLYATRIDGLRCSSDAEAVAQALSLMGAAMESGSGVPTGVPFHFSGESPYFVVEQLNAAGTVVQEAVYGEDGCEPAVAQRAEVDLMIAQAFPGDAASSASYDRGFRDALESVVAHLCQAGVGTHLQAKELVQTVLDAFENNAPEPSTGWLVVQEGGSSTELYVHVSRERSEAEAFRASASEAAYRTSPVLEVPACIAEAGEGAYQFIEEVLQSLSEFDVEECLEECGDDASQPKALSTGVSQ